MTVQVTLSLSITIKGFSVVSEAEVDSKGMLKILQARLQQDVKWELPDVQAGVGKGKRSRDQIVNICWIREKAREFQKSINFCFIDYAKVFDCVEQVQ